MKAETRQIPQKLAARLSLFVVQQNSFSKITSPYVFEITLPLLRFQNLIINYLGKCLGQLCIV